MGLLSRQRGELKEKKRRKVPRQLKPAEAFVGGGSVVMPRTEFEINPV